MFSLGLAETFFIILAIIILLKPEDYAKFAKKCAKLIRQLQIIWNQLLNKVDLYDE